MLLGSGMGVAIYLWGSMGILRMKTLYTLSWLIGLVGCLHAAIASAEVAPTAPKIQTLDQYTRIQIPVANASTFRLIRGSGADSTIVLERISLSQLAALKSLSDKRVSGS